MGFLKGKVAPVTGGNRGVGRGICDALAAEGATVVLTARSAPAAEQAAKEIGGGALGFACDVRSQEQVERLFRRIDETAGGSGACLHRRRFQGLDPGPPQRTIRSRRARRAPPGARAPAGSGTIRP